MFLFRLALALGKTVRELLSSMDSAEFSEWIEYATHIEPLPADRAALGHAVTAQAVVAANRRRGAPVPPLGEFVPRLRRDGPQSEAEIHAGLSRFKALVERARARKG